MAKVSIIVINHGTAEEANRMSRCLTMVKRQHFKDWELFFEKEEEDAFTITEDEISKIHEVDQEERFGKYLYHVMKQACGEYVQFVNPSFIMAPNVIGALVESIESEKSEESILSDEIPVVSHFVSINGETAAEIKSNLYGKLIPAETILQMIQEDEERFCSLSEYTFWLMCLAKGHILNPVEHTYIYGESVPAPIEGDLADIAEDADGQWITLLDSLSEKERFQEIDKVIAHLEMEKVPYSIIEQQAQVFSDDNELQLLMTKKYMKHIYQNSLQEDADAYECTKKYLDALSSKPELVEVLLQEMGISSDQKKLIDRYQNLKDYLFFKDRIPSKAENGETEDGAKDSEFHRIGTQEEQLMQKINTLPQKNDIERLDRIESLLVRLMEEETPKVNTEVVREGPALAEYTIQQYEQGKLGLRTILASFIAWIKYKL